MKIYLLFTKHSNGFDDGTLQIGKFPTKKAAYHYVSDFRKFYAHGYFTLRIEKNNRYYLEDVRAQDILNLKP